MPLRVLIAGAGMGGLCLAQGLRKAGIEVEVFERDASAEVRGQGFRFRIDAHGDAALRDCLPENLYELYQATSSEPAAPPSAAYDSQMKVIFRMPSRGSSQNSSSSQHVSSSQHTSVNRGTLREVLMGGLGGMIRFDHELIEVEKCDSEIAARFANGASVRGDVLVAADGIGSVVRRQTLPEAELMDTGMRCIYGITPLSNALLKRLPESFSAGFIPFVGPERRTLAMGMFRTRGAMADVARQIAPAVRITPVSDYLMWLCVAPLDAYGMTDGALRSAGGAALQRKALELTEDWHTTLRDVLERAETSTLFQVPIRTSLPVGPWRPSRVTLLGDAIHAMTPAGGIGANTAFRDAELLTKRLSEANRGERDVVDAIAQYEAEMRAYGFAAVQKSLEGAVQLYRVAVPEREVVR